METSKLTYEQLHEQVAILRDRFSEAEKEIALLYVVVGVSRNVICSYDTRFLGDLEDPLRLQNDIDALENAIGAWTNRNFKRRLRDERRRDYEQPWPLHYLFR